MIETLVHYEVRGIPPPFQLLRIEVPEDMPFLEWPPAKSVQDAAATRSWGDTWLASGATALARVPSVIAPQGYNWLMNPGHKGSKQIRITEKSRWPWDQRLFRS